MNSYPSSSVDVDTARILRRIHGAEKYADDREAVVEAIVRASLDGFGYIDPNVVRYYLRGQEIKRRVVGAVYHALARAEVIEPAGWVISDDVEGRNAGKPARTWRLIG